MKLGRCIELNMSYTVPQKFYKSRTGGDFRRQKIKTDYSVPYKQIQSFFDFFFIFSSLNWLYSGQLMQQVADNLLRGHCSSF